jgi:hypothetical protein
MLESSIAGVLNVVVGRHEKRFWVAKTWRTGAVAFSRYQVVKPPTTFGELSNVYRTILLLASAQDHVFCLLLQCTCSLFYYYHELFNI